MYVGEIDSQACHARFFKTIGFLGFFTGFLEKRFLPNMNEIFREQIL